MQPIAPKTPFVPFDNESDVMEIGDLTIENRIDQVILYGSLVLQKDLGGLERVRRLRELLTDVVVNLETTKNLPEKIAPRPAELVNNPFGQAVGNVLPTND